MNSFIQTVRCSCIYWSTRWNFSLENFLNHVHQVLHKFKEPMQLKCNCSKNLFIPNCSDNFLSFFLLEFEAFLMILDFKNPQHLFIWSKLQIGLAVGVPFYCVFCISLFFFVFTVRCLKWVTPFVFRRRQLCVLADFQERREHREVSLDVSVGALRNGRMALNYWPAWQLTTLRLRFLSPSSLFTALSLPTRHIHSESIKAAEGNTKVITV